MAFWLTVLLSTQSYTQSVPPPQHQALVSIIDQMLQKMPLAYTILI